MKNVYIPVNSVPALPRSSGTVQYALNLAKRLRALGHDVTLIATGPSSPWRGMPVMSVSQTPIREVAFSRRLFRVARTKADRNSSVVIANGEHYAYPFLFSRNPQKVILVAHGPLALRLRKRHPLISLVAKMVIEPRVLSHSQAVIAVDTESMGYYSRKYPDSRCFQLGVGVDETLFSPGSRSEARASLGLPQVGEFVLVVGRPSWEKNLALAARTFLALSREHETMHLVLIGSTPEQAFSAELRSHLPADRFHPLGLLDQSAMVTAYRASNLLLITSREEQLPTVALEALACGVPVVGTRVGDLPKLLADGVAGRCAAPSEDLLAEAVVDTLERTRQDPHTLEAACTEVAKAYSWTHTARVISELVESL